MPAHCSQIAVCRVHGLVAGTEQAGEYAHERSQLLCENEKAAVGVTMMCDSEEKISSE